MMGWETLADLVNQIKITSMCTSGIMYMEEEEVEEIADEVIERVCSYSGLLSVSEYQLIDHQEE